MDRWKWGRAPEPYGVTFVKARYVVLLVMAGDGDLERQLHPDFYEMVRAVNQDVAVLVLVDYREREGAQVLEILPGVTKPVCRLPEICTGDPRPIADFFARGLVSFSDEARFALGFWGHGSGVFKDYDSGEILLRRELRFGPLGAKVDPEFEWTLEAERRWKQSICRSMLPDVTSDNCLTNREASSALAAAFSRAGRTEPVDLLFFDTCLNGSVEVFAELGRFAKVFVASSLLVPGDGWNYHLWLKATDRERPATAEAWADLAVAIYGHEFGPGKCLRPAQLVATRTDVDFVGAFRELVEELKGRGVEGAVLVGKAARETHTLFYGENLELNHLVATLKRLNEDDAALVARCDRFLELHEEAIVSVSTPHPGGEELFGMTIWCPISGDKGKVGRYYRGLEFNRVTDWSSILEMGSEPLPAGARDWKMYAFWGLKLLSAGDVERTEPSSENEERRLRLAIPEECAEFSGGMVEGEYAFEGDAASIYFPDIGILRGLWRKLCKIRIGKEFEALRGCGQREWTIAGEACARLARDFSRYEATFANVAEGAELQAFRQMKLAFERTGDNGAVLFL